MVGIMRELILNEDKLIKLVSNFIPLKNRKSPFQFLGMGDT